MLEPHGPLPPEIYWRRRVLAAVLALLAVLVVVLLIVFVGGGDDSSKNAAVTASSTAAGASGLPSAPPSDGADPSVAGGDGGAPGAGTPGSGAPQPGAPSASASAAANPSGAGVPTPGAVVAGAPCPDSNISVVVSADKPSYTVGEQPTFEATVTNAGPVACSRDIGTGQQQLIVLTLDGSKQLWSNFDCTFQPGIKNEVLQPGQQLRYKLQWAGTTSAPGCQGQRVPLAPGAYQVVAQLGAKRSAPVTFNFVKAAEAPAPGN